MLYHHQGLKQTIQGRQSPASNQPGRKPIIKLCSQSIIQNTKSLPPAPRAIYCVTNTPQTISTPSCSITQRRLIGSRPPPTFLIPPLRAPLTIILALLAWLPARVPSTHGALTFPSCIPSHPFPQPTTRKWRKHLQRHRHYLARIGRAKPAAQKL